jgi:glycosyltransferase involved in cell wall biosynthesis/SAM-dependent methyltransferase
MTRSTRFCVTLDVERDYGKGWETPTTRTFRSVVEALPQRFEPLCKAHGTRPTYLVSAEAMLDLDAAAALRSRTDCELGAHLHAEYLPPGPRPAQWSDPSLRIRAMQRDLAPEDERERLATLTRLFEQQFGRRPTSFRAGRFGAGPRTGAFLQELGYVVDSSATPLVAWPGNDGTDGPDWRNVPSTPWRAHRSGDLRLAGDSPLFEIPVTIVEAARIGCGGKDPTWLRPWYSDRATMLAILEAAARDEDRGMPWRTLCMMFHSMELVAGASPYAQTESEVDRVLADLDAVFARAKSLGFVAATLTEAADALARDDDDAVRSRATRIDPAAWNGDRARWRAFSESVDPAPTLAAHAVQPWFLYSIEQRHERWDNCLGYSWLCENAPHEAPILDVGCGPGVNLQWLARNGKTDLHGCDLDGKAVAAGRELAASTGADIQLFCDDGRTLDCVPHRKHAAIAAMNWIQLVDGFDLDAFLGRVTERLAEGGLLLLDYVDEAFGRDPRSRWLTSDWSKPEAERRPSEYRTRFSPALLTDALRRRGFSIERHWRIDGPVPRGVVGCRLGGASLPRVVYVVDAKGWAHDKKAQSLCRELASRYDGRIVYQDALTARDLDEADLVVVFYWRQLQSLERLAEPLSRIRGKLLMGVCSHNELEGEHRSPGLAALRRLPRAVFTHSALLEAEVRPLVGGAAWSLPNGVDSAFYAPDSAPRSRATGAPLVVGWAGSVANFGAEMRGLPNVIQPACAALPGVELRIAAREDRLRTADEMRAFYRSLDVYVCASRVEGTPNPCLEAAACGVPVVTTAVGNMPELIAHGENGYLLPRSADAFAVALARLRDDERLRLTMGTAIRRRIEAEWDWSRRAEGFAAMFDAALAAPRGEREAAACVTRGLDALRRHDRVAAAVAFTHALDADSRCALAHAHLANLWWDEGTHDSALTALGFQRQALLLGREDRAVCAALADLLRRQGKSDLAATLVAAT